jgi:trimeric autotransporter adhesin
MGIPRQLLPIPVLLALALAGCGGGGDDDSTAAAPVETTEATTALSKEELVAQGDGICAEVNAAVGTVGSTSSAASGQAAQVAGLYGGMVERLKGLGAPSDESAGYAEFIASAEALAQAEDNVKLASEREEGEALSEAEADASSALTSFQSAASTFGLEDCAEAPAAPVPSGSVGEAGSEEAGGVTPEEVEEVAPEEAEVAPEEAPPVEEEGAGGGAGVGGGTEGGGTAGGGGSSGGVGPG